MSGQSRKSYGKGKVCLPRVLSGNLCLGKGEKFKAKAKYFYQATFAEDSVSVVCLFSAGWSYQTFLYSTKIYLQTFDKAR